VFRDSLGVMPPGADVRRDHRARPSPLVTTCT
jgi:hypothetical protein